MGLPLQPMDMAVRLADEGVPLRAIARATAIPTEDLREQLYKARYDGRLTSLPNEDWPPGFPRDQRALELSRLELKSKGAINQKVAELFKLTPLQAKVLLMLLQTQVLTREHEGLETACLKVHIHHLRRKMKVFGISVETVWGFGYRLSGREQNIVTSLILRHVPA